MPLTELSLSDVSSDDFQYIAEGGANIVVRYTGPNAAWQGTALRIRKKPLDGPASHASDQEDPVVAFNQRIVSAVLLPGDWTAPLVSLKVQTPSFLVELARSHSLLRQRPLWRQAAGVIDTSRHYIVATEDLTDSAVAVEIKPKWGFLPSAVHLIDNSSATKLRHCRFCMHQHHRKSEPGFQSTEYCPLDLYSHDNERVKKAVQALFKTWHASEGKGNQLRIFVGGKMCLPKDIKILHNALQLPNPTPPILHEHQLIELLIEALRRSEVLDRLKLTQSRLDPLDIEGLAALALRETGKTLDKGALNGVHAASLDELAELAKNMLAMSPPANFREAALAYTLSASVKDCSIMCRIKMVNGKIDSDVKAVDVDPKPLAKLPEWARLDHAIKETAQRDLKKAPCMPG